MRAKNTVPCPHGVITGKGNQCSKCYKLREKPEVRIRRLEKALARMNIWKTENREQHLANQRRYAKRKRDLRGDEVRAYNRKRAGLPVPTRPEPKFCEICGGPPRGKHKRLVLDHCHITGIFRGWTCDICNRAIGMLGDLPSSIENASRYMERAYAAAK